MAQDGLGVCRGDQHGERRDHGRLRARLHQGGDGGMNLVVDELDRPRRQRTQPGVRRKRISDRTPGLIVVDVSPERGGQRPPANPAGRPPERRHRHRLEAKFGMMSSLVPDQRHLPVQVVGLAVERSLANCCDEVGDHAIVDLLGLDPIGAGIAGEARQTQMCPLARKPGHEGGPTRAQRGLARPRHRFQPADLHGREEAGADVGVKFLTLIPSAIGLMPASLALIARRSSGMRAGSSPSSSANSIYRRLQDHAPWWVRTRSCSARGR